LIAALRRSLGASGLARRLAGDSAWVALETIATRGGMIVALWLAARELGPAAFGALVAVQGTLVLVASIVAYAVRVSATCEMGGAQAESRPRVIGTVVWIAVGGGLLLAVLLAASAGPIATELLARHELAPLLRTGSLLVLLECCTALQLGLLTGAHAMRAAAWTGAVASAVLVLAVGVGVAAHGAAGAVWGLVAGSAASVSLRWRPVARVLAAQRVDLSLVPRQEDLRTLARISVPTAALNLLWTPTIWLGTLMLLRVPDGYVQLGLLGAANQWFAALLFLPNVLGFATLPHLSAAERSGTSRLRATADLALHASVIGSVALAALVIAASPWIMASYGEPYRAAWPALAWLAAATVPAAAFGIVGNVLTVTGHWRQLLGAQAAWAACYLGCAAAGLWAGMGAMALGMAMLAGNTARLLWSRRHPAG
jgi:O-antigen/teichoic acid export membrane protein